MKPESINSHIKWINNLIIFDANKHLLYPSFPKACIDTDCIDTIFLLKNTFDTTFEFHRDEIYNWLHQEWTLKKITLLQVYSINH